MTPTTDTVTNPQDKAILHVLVRTGSTPIANTDLIIQAMQLNGDDPLDKAKAGRLVKNNYGTRTTTLFKKGHSVRRLVKGRIFNLPFPADGVVPDGWTAHEGDRYAPITTRKVGATSSRKKDPAYWTDLSEKELARHRAVLAQIDAGLAECVAVAQQEAEAAQQRATDIAAAVARSAQTLAGNGVPA
jgi:hypothetical protein